MPGKPRTCELFRLIFVKRLMHKACISIRSQQHGNAQFDFLIVLRRHGTYDYAHGPHHVHSYVRATDAFGIFALEKIRIVQTQQIFSRILINPIRGLHIADVGQSQQTGNISIIHAELIAVSVHFKSINLSIGRMLVYGMFFQRFAHFHIQHIARTSHCFVFVHLQ